MTASAADKVVTLPVRKAPLPIEEIVANAIVDFLADAGRSERWEVLEPGEKSYWIAAIAAAQRAIEPLPDEQKRFFHSVEDRGHVKGVGMAAAELVRRHDQVDVAAQVMTFLGVSAAACEAAGVGGDLIAALRRAEKSQGGVRYAGDQPKF